MWVIKSYDLDLHRYLCAETYVIRRKHKFEHVTQPWSHCCWYCNYTTTTVAICDDGMRIFTIIYSDRYKVRIHIVEWFSAYCFFFLLNQLIVSGYVCDQGTRYNTFRVLGNLSLLWSTRGVFYAAVVFDNTKRTTKKSSDLPTNHSNFFFYISWMFSTKVRLLSCIDLYAGMRKSIDHIM